jgi:hypothetical protein
VFDVDPVDLLARELLRERAPALVAQVCAWSVGLSDRPFLRRRGGRVEPTAQTLGARAELDQPLGAEPDGHLELGDARPGTFADALAALAPGGRVWADVLDEQVLVPFVLDTCVRAAGRARRELPDAWAELLDDLGDDGSDLGDVVRAAGWEAPLRTEAEQLVLAALGAVPLVEVEAEGLPLSLVQAAERLTRDAAQPPPAAGPDDDELAGALFLAEAALRSSGLPTPVPPAAADALLETLLGEGLEPDEVRSLLPHLPVHQDTADEVEAALTRLPPAL